MTDNMSSNQYPPGPTNARATLTRFARDPLGTMLDLYDTYGDFVHYQLGPSHVYLINRPQLLKQVLVDLNDSMARTQLTHDTVGRLLGNGLLVSAGDFHKQQRRIIQPAFTPAWIGTYAAAVVQATVDLMRTWTDGSVRDIVADMTALTMQIVYRTIFGNSTSNVDDKVRAAIGVLQQYAGDALVRKTSTAIGDAQIANARADLHEAVDTLLNQRRQQRAHDFLSLLLDTRNPVTGEAMSQDQIRIEAVNFFVAGQETSAIALVWSWWLLARHPHTEQRLWSELDATLQAGLPTLDNLERLPWLDKVIKESMRLMPPAWLIGRRPITPVVLDGYTITPDDSIAISPYVLHRNPAIYPDPLVFNPDRFDHELPRYSYLPFGAGAHVCIGQPFGMMEIALIMATIGRAWRLELVEEQTVVPIPLLTLRPNIGIQMRVHQR